MTNYKNYLKEIIEESASELRANLSDEAQEFIADAYIDGAYICDVINDFSDGRTSIYYSDIREFISNNVDAVNDAIAKYGWNGCGCDLYKAGQIAEAMQIQNNIECDLTDTLKYIFIDCLLTDDYINEDIENRWKALTEDEREAIAGEVINAIEMLDSNDRFDELEAIFKTYLNNILND